MEQDLTWLKNNYGKLTPAQCADHFNISVDAVRTKANRIGLTSGRYLTEDQKRYIDKNIGKASYRKMAKKIGRSYACIKTYAYRNGNNMINNDKNKISTTEAARLVGRCRVSITRNWFNRGLKHRMIGGWYMIDIDDLLEFMQENTDLWDATECEKWFFQNYSWYQEKRKEDLKKLDQKRWGNYYSV